MKIDSLGEGRHFKVNKRFPVETGLGATGLRTGERGEGEAPLSCKLQEAPTVWRWSPDNRTSRAEEMCSHLSPKPC